MGGGELVDAFEIPRLELGISCYTFEEMILSRAKVGTFGCWSIAARLRSPGWRVR